MVCTASACERRDAITNIHLQGSQNATKEWEKGQQALDSSKEAARKKSDLSQETGYNTDENGDCS